MVDPVNASDTPRVSIIIPAYNAETYLGDAIRSVLTQSFGNIELILVNDGSTDETAAIMQSFTDPRVQIHQQANLGVCAARNLGISKSKGQYLVFLDSDDVLLEDKIECQLAALDAYRPRIPRLEIVNSGWSLISADGEKLNDVTPWTDAPRLDFADWLLWKPIFPGALMLDREAVAAIGGFDERLKQAEDVDLILRMAANGSKALWLYQTTVLYRQHGSNTFLDSPQQAQDLSAVLERFFARVDLPRSVRKLERRVRYNTFIWMIWLLTQTDQLDEATTYLKQTLSVSPYQPISNLTVIDWQVKLLEHVQRHGASPEDIRDLWPAMRQASGLPGPEWETVKRSLEMHLALWDNYAFKNIKDIAYYREMSQETMVSAAAPLVFVAYRTKPDNLRFLHENLKSAGVLTDDRRSRFSSLFLILATKKLYEGGWRECLVCLWEAIRLGITMPTITIWSRVIRTAAKSFLHQRGRL